MNYSKQIQKIYSSNVLKKIFFDYFIYEPQKPES